MTKKIILAVVLGGISAVSLFAVGFKIKKAYDHYKEMKPILAFIEIQKQNDAKLREEYKDEIAEMMLRVRKIREEEKATPRK